MCVVLREKALEINQKLGGPTDFKASTGWLKNFKSCCGIRKLEVQGESLSSNAPAADKQKFGNFLKTKVTLWMMFTTLMKQEI